MAPWRLKSRVSTLSSIRRRRLGPASATGGAAAAASISTPAHACAAAPATTRHAACATKPNNAPAAKPIGRGAGATTPTVATRPAPAIKNG